MKMNALTKRHHNAAAHEAGERWTQEKLSKTYVRILEIFEEFPEGLSKARLREIWDADPDLKTKGESARKRVPELARMGYLGFNGHREFYDGSTHDLFSLPEYVDEEAIWLIAESWEERKDAFCFQCANHGAPGDDNLYWTGERILCRECKGEGLTEVWA